MKEQLLAEMILLLHKYFHKLHKFMTIPYIKIGFILCRNLFFGHYFSSWYNKVVQLGYVVHLTYTTRLRLVVYATYTTRLRLVV